MMVERDEQEDMTRKSLLKVLIGGKTGVKEWVLMKEVQMVVVVML